VGQVINVFPALKNTAADPYPSYVDPTLVTWTPSNQAIASINSNGVVLGVSEGTATIAAQYQGHSSQLTVQVSGAFISRNIAVSGQGTRHYSIYVPPFGSDAGPHPAIISLHGGGGSNDPHYFLTMTVKEAVIDLGLQENSTSTRGQVRLTIKYALTDAENGKVVLSETLRTSTGYNILINQFSSLLSQDDAENQGLQQISDQMTEHLALYFQKNPNP